MKVARLAGLSFFAISTQLIAQQPPASPQAGSQPGWRADPKLLQQMEAKKTSYIYKEEQVPEYKLPDPLLLSDGTRITSSKDWETKGRPQTLELFRTYVYGRQPDSASLQVKFEVIDTNKSALDGLATQKRIKITPSIGDKSYTFETQLFTPNKLGKKAPVFVLINNRATASADPSRQSKDEFWPVEEILAHGYGTAVFQTNAVDPDKNGDEFRAKGVRGVFKSPGKAGEDEWATIATWAWGASRVADYLQTDPDVDASKLAIIGHSRGGKTALWTGAEDQRFSIAISNDSGCGGAAISRRKFGETVAQINKGFPYWFDGNFKKFNNKEEDLPIDQHQLIALIAPRAVYVASADQDFWADQRGEFLSLVHASPVYALYGLENFSGEPMPPLERPVTHGKMGYHIRKGGHGLTAYDWTQYLHFADQVWK